jgi:2-hydroxycyclohexanecarboxyl-CoA dehydrogenase
VPASPSPLVHDYAESAVVIAGGTSGVGLASALTFIGAGVRRLALLARDPVHGHAAAERVQQRCPGAQVEFIAADAADPAQAGAAVSKAHSSLGGIDVLVNSTASAYRPELLHRTRRKTWRGSSPRWRCPPCTSPVPRCR